MEFLQTHRLSQSIVNVRNVAPVREHKLAAADPSLSLSVFGELLKTYCLFNGRGAGDL